MHSPLFVRLRQRAFGLSLACAALFPGCAGGNDAPTVRLELASDFAAGADGTLRLAREGRTLVIERAHLSITSLRLVLCESTGQARRRWRLGVIGAAHAHGATTSTMLGVPVIVDLLAMGDSGVVAGELRPPEAAFCSVTLEAGPGDADALGLSQAPELLGLTLRASGHVARPGAPDHPFTVTSRLRASGAGALAPLRIGEGGRQRTTIRIGIDPARLFGEVELDRADGEAAGRDALGALGRALTLTAL